jgi:integrase
LNKSVSKTIQELRKNGYSDATVDGYARKLKFLSRHADLNSPETVKAVIAARNCSTAFKEALVNAYDHYVQACGLVWNKPVYPRSRALPYVASPEQVGKVISRASRRYALIFSIFRDSGIRPVELCRLTLQTVDLEKGTLTIPGTKFGNPRLLILKPSTVAMFNDYLHSRQFSLDDQLFPNPGATRHAFERYRNDVAKKLHEPELQKIRLYDLRHFFATMLYYRTKDILYVKEQLGHRRIENTLIYTHLVAWGPDEFVCKVACFSEDARALVEGGFDYVATSPEGEMLFKKRK